MNKLTSTYKSASAYIPEVAAAAVLLTAGLLLFEKDLSTAIVLFILILLSSAVLLYLIGKKRNAQLKQIGEILSNIGKSVYQSSDEIILPENLASIEHEIKKMFEKTRTDIEYLKKLERMRTEFIANVSHELRTPIFTIQGYIETLLNGALNDEKVNKYFLEKANQHTINLSNLLNDLIDISMIESGEMRMSFRYFNLEPFLDELVEEFASMAEEKNLKLYCSPVKSNLQVFGDKAKLRQVMVNLLTNALKYTEQGEIYILVKEEGKFVRIIVKDSGLGISSEDLNRVFERFYRVDKARSRSVGGTGLGLAIVKHILDAHNTKIEVKSEEGRGSEFSFLLKK